ncbi:MAG: SDR family NAD(P)-dependent oxidoreductase [Ignavibacteria bacterium]|jgi:short-subunit dehydrogenase
MNEVALITGASGGIGYQIALLFAKSNIDVVLVARSPEKLQRAEASLTSISSARVFTVVADLSSREGIGTLLNFINEHQCTVTYLVNNAGFGDYGMFVDRSMDNYSEMIRLNIESLTALTHHFATRMVHRGKGRILNIASTAGFQPDPRFAVYGATKAYVISFSEALHKELENTGVSVTVLSPGATRTDFIDRADMHDAKVFEGNVMTAPQVADVGFRAMMQGKLHVVPGLTNRIMALLSSITPPGKLRLAIADKVMQRKKD